MREKISPDAVLKKLPSWALKSEEPDAITRTYVFKDFKTAWSFMSAAALKAESMDHHP